jgi:hypothetical protein
MRLLTVCLLAAACSRSSGSGYVVHRVQGTVEVDGILAEAAWNRAAEAGPLVRSLDGRPAGASTTVRMLWDDQFLYVAFQCEDPNVGGAFFKDDEPLYTSNVVEIFLNPSGDLRHYAEIELAPTNALFDASFTGPREGMQLSWSSGAKHAVHVDGTLNNPSDIDRGWTAELAIPFAGLPGAPHPKRGDAWRFNVYRLRQGPGQPDEGQALSPPLRPDFHAVDRFATLRFGD